MPDFVRVKDRETGHHVTIPRDALDPAVYRELNEDPLSADGTTPRPPEYAPGTKFDPFTPGDRPDAVHVGEEPTAPSPAKKRAVAKRTTVKKRATPASVAAPAPGETPDEGTKEH